MRKCNYCDLNYHPDRFNRGYCSLQCRIIDKTIIDVATGCHFWQGPLDSKGYGQLTINGRMCLVHRWIFYASQSKEYKRHVVIMHSCNNPKCVNPQHLFEGSQKENIQYAAACGRMGRARGENNGASKLTDVQVKLILEKWENSQKKYGLLSKLGREFNTSNTTIGNIVNKRYRVL